VEPWVQSTVRMTNVTASTLNRYTDTRREKRNADIYTDGRFVGWSLVGRLVVRLVVSRLVVGWLVGWLVGWSFVGRFVGR
jgi:hypothetical protein